MEDENHAGGDGGSAAHGLDALVACPRPLISGDGIVHAGLPRRADLGGLPALLLSCVARVCSCHGGGGEKTTDNGERERGHWETGRPERKIRNPATMIALAMT
jgi:hypothetical protein